MQKIIVSKNKDCEFNTINEALNTIDLNEEALIYIEDGVYFEKLDIKHKNISLEGQSRENTIIMYDDYALKNHKDGNEYGTFRTFTINTSSDNITLKNLTIKNISGVGSEFGQAVALSLCAKSANIINCNLNAFQDTVFMSPFPPSPLIKNSFKGDFDKEPNLVHKNNFDNCSISGDVDFIFGGGIAYFNNCEIYSNNLGKDNNGYITAASTPENFEFGFVFESCRLTSKANAETVYLGRPWRNFAKTVFLRCDFGNHIKPEGFHNWNKLDAENTVLYAHYNCTGSGSDISKNANFVKQLTDDEAKKYTKENILK